MPSVVKAFKSLDGSKDVRVNPLLHPGSVLRPVGARLVAVDGGEDSEGAVLEEGGGLFVGRHGTGDVVEVGGGVGASSVV